MANSPTKKRSPIFLGVFFLVLMLIVYYVFAYIPQKELDLQNRGIRVMNRMEKNIQSKEQHYNKSLETYFCEYIVRKGRQHKIPFNDSLNPAISNCLHKTDIVDVEDVDPHVSVTTDPSLFIIAKERNGAFVGLKAQDLLEDVKHFTFFDDVFLVDQENGKVIDSSKLDINIFNYASGKLIGKTIYNEKGKVEERVGVDINNPISGVSISEQEISNTDYYCYTKEVTIDETTYYLTGLISIDNYNSQVRAVSVWVVVITFVFMIFIIQILPIVKPFLMNAKDRLKSTDLMWSGVSLIFGLSALVLFTLSIDTFVLEEKDLVDVKLEKYSDYILSDFEQERKTVYDILLHYNAHRNEGDSLNAIKFKTDSAFEVSAKNFIGDQKNHFSILEVDNEGQVIHYFKYYKDGKLLKVSSETDIKHREYVQVHINDNGVLAWAPPDSSLKKEDRHPTYLESIFSMATGKYETAMSIRVAENRILVLVYPFSTVNSIYLEPNYQFAVIDRKGMIQYHSDKSKIHNENIVDESNQDQNLKAYLHNGSQVHLDLKISLKDYSVYLTPIANTSFYFMTMYNIKKSRLTISSSMATTFQFILAILVYLLLIHSLLKLERFLSKYPSSKAVTYYFLNPSKTQDWMYYKLATLNVASVLFLLIIYHHNQLHLVNSALLFFATITTSSLYNYHELTRQKRKVLELTYPFSSIPLTVFEFALLALSIFWIGLFGIRNLATLEMIAAVYPVLILGMFAFSKRFHKQSTRSDLHSVDTKIYRAYYIHAFSWIFILSIMSTLLFFKPIYNRQHLKRVTHNLQEEYFERVKLQNWSTHKLNIDDPDKATKPVNKDDETKHKDDGTRDLLDAISVYFDKEDSQLKGLHKSENLAVNLKQDLNETFFSLELEPYSKFFNHKESEMKATTIRTFSLPTFNFFGEENHTKENVESLFFWVILLVSLLATYQTIVHLSEKFFHLRLAQDLIRISPREKIKLNEDKNDIIGLDLRKKNILLVGLPFSGRNSFLREAIASINDEIKTNNEKFKNEPNTERISGIDFEHKLAFDFINSTQEILTTIKAGLDLNLPVIINNYDYSISDFDDNTRKLEILEFILGQRTVDRRDNFLVLIGSLDIYQILDLYREHIKTLISTGAEKKEIDARRKDVDRWESVLYSFTKHIIPMLPKSNLKPKNSTQAFIYSELNYTGLLSKLIPHIENYAYNLLVLGESRDGLESKTMQEIQSMAENYYFSLWNSFSKEEKFILLDLAEDGLINTANNKVIQNLIRKGIITLNPDFQIFNKSFGNFILESISEEESKQIELEAKKGGSWSSYRYLVIFLVIIIVIFLSFVEEQAFTQLTGIVSLGAAMAPKIISSISSLTTKKKTA